MGQIRGIEFHSIISNVFGGDVHGLGQSSQLQVNCPRCMHDQGLSYPDGKYNLEINTSKKVYRCWRCDAPQFSGSLGKLIKTYGNSIDYELYKSYASIYHDDDEYDEWDGDYEYDEIDVTLPKEMILFSEMDENDVEHLEAYNYLVIERKIDRGSIFKYNLGFCISGWFSRRIIIPSYNELGNINYSVSRSYDPKEKKRKYLNPNIDKNRFIFNIGKINFDSTICLVEGVFDMFSVPNAIPLLGKTISTPLFLKLKELKPEIIVLLDPDAYKNSLELYYTLHTIYVDCEERVRIVKLPTMDDIDELRRKHGIDEVIKSLRSARYLTRDDYFINKLQKPYGNNGRGRYILIQNILNGNRASEEIFFNKYKNIIKNYLKNKYLNYNIDDIDDCVSEILIKVFYSLDKYDSEKSGVKNWVLSITKNFMIDTWRHKSSLISNNVSLLDYNSNQYLSTCDSAICWSDYTIKTTTMCNNSYDGNMTTFDNNFENNNTLSYISSQISPNDYCLLDMKYIQGYNYDEIGKEFQITSSTVSNRINYIKSKLKKNNSEVIYD